MAIILRRMTGSIIAPPNKFRGINYAGMVDIPTAVFKDFLKYTRSDSTSVRGH